MSTVHAGEFADGTEWEVRVSSGRVFRAYDVPGLERFEVSHEAGVIAANWHTLPDELTREQAVALSALLLESAG